MEIFFQRLMIHTPEIFQVFVAFIGDISKTTASSDTDTTLSLALKQFDAQNDKIIFEIPYGSVFRIENGRF
jgi:hypothetical protein